MNLHLYYVGYCKFLSDLIFLHIGTYLTGTNLTNRQLHLLIFSSKYIPMYLNFSWKYEFIIHKNP